MSVAAEAAPDLMPIAVLIDELKHDDQHVRLTATRQLGTIGAQRLRRVQQPGTSSLASRAALLGPHCS
jgi:hypothetical protein